MCKHVAAVLYGVERGWTTNPEWLVRRCGVNHEELIEADAEQAVAAATSRGKSKRLAEAQLGEIFGIELDPGVAGPAAQAPLAEDAADSKPPTKRRTTSKTAKTQRKAARKGTNGAASVAAKGVKKPKVAKTASKPAGRRRTAGPQGSGG